MLETKCITPKDKRKVLKAKKTPKQQMEDKAKKDLNNYLEYLEDLNS